jgi:hypothetical protein
MPPPSSISADGSGTGVAFREYSASVSERIDQLSFQQFIRFYALCRSLPRIIWTVVANRPGFSRFWANGAPSLKIRVTIAVKTALLGAWPESFLAGRMVEIVQAVQKMTADR